MTIKGTLETFNLLDLMQMLALNQKVGTLALETVRGPRTVHVDRGLFGFVQGDPHPSRTLARVLRRTASVPPDRLERGARISEASGCYLGDALAELGVLDGEQRAAHTADTARELFFDLLQTSITRFEFVEGKRLAPDGREGAAIEPLLPVDGVLIELTRRIDEWALLRQDVPTDEEVYERTGGPADASSVEGVPAYLGPRVLPLVDGRRSVAAIVEDSDGDRFEVMKVLSHLLREDALAPVPTPALLSRAEELLASRRTRDAAALLRRAVERPDGSPALRVRLGEALEAAGDAAAAAAEYEAHASACEAIDAWGAFESLLRVARLRGRDASTAARVCDLYLRNHQRLRPRAAEAIAALRALVDGATASGHAAEAALRLTQFVDAGDAPADDLLVLADLWATAGRPSDAAAALARRGDLLVREGRLAQARDVLRRALSHDPTRADVRRKVAEIEAQQRRSKRRRRLVEAGTLLALTLGTAGAVWLVYDGKAARAVEDAMGRADRALEDAERAAGAAVGAWNRAVADAAAGRAPEGSLAEAASTLRSDLQAVATRLRTEVGGAQRDVARQGDNARAETGAMRLKSAEARAAAIAARADQCVAEVNERARKALEAGEQAFAEGRFLAAAEPLREAIRLSMPGETRGAQARRSLEQVDRYASAFAERRKAFDAADAAGDTDTAWREACALLSEFLDSDLTQTLRVPVPVAAAAPEATAIVCRAAASDPGRGATPVDGATATALPAVVRYAPFGTDDLVLALRAPGHTPRNVPLPRYEALRAASRESAVPLRVSLALEPGPRWTRAEPGLCAGPFLVGDQVWSVVGDGARIAGTRLDGTGFEPAVAGRPKDRIRAVGRGGGGTWLVSGLRTLTFFADGAEAPWEHAMPGRLTRGPAVAAGLVVLADDTGVVRAFDPRTGAPRWEAALAAPPTQAPLVTSVGVLVPTESGEVVLLGLADGRAKPVVAPTPGRTPLAVAWEGGALVLGAEGMGLRRVTGGARAAPVEGSSDPLASAGAVLAPSGCAWVERDGTVRCLARTGPSPVAVPALGKTAFAPAIADDVLYAAGTDGVLRAASAAAPDTTLWSAPLGSPARASPLVVGDLVLVRTGAGLLAFDR